VITAAGPRFSQGRLSRTSSGSGIGGSGLGPFADPAALQQEGLRRPAPHSSTMSESPGASAAP